MMTFGEYPPNSTFHLISWDHSCESFSWSFSKNLFLIFLPFKKCTVWKTRVPHPGLSAAVSHGCLGDRARGPAVRGIHRHYKSLSADHSLTHTHTLTQCPTLDHWPRACHWGVEPGWLRRHGVHMPAFQCIVHQISERVAIVDLEEWEDNEEEDDYQLLRAWMNL